MIIIENIVFWKKAIIIENIVFWKKAIIIENIVFWNKAFGGNEPDKVGVQANRTQKGISLAPLPKLVKSNDSNPRALNLRILYQAHHWRL